MTELTLNPQLTIVISVGGIVDDVDISYLCAAHKIPFIRQVRFEDLLSNKFQDRSQLILLGGPVETELTHIALEAMLQNFQVFVLVDKLVSDIQIHRDSVLERLYQNGAAPLLWVQMLHEIKSSKK